MYYQEVGTVNDRFQPNQLESQGIYLLTLLTITKYFNV